MQEFGSILEHMSKSMDRQDAKIDAIRDDISELRTDLAVLRERSVYRADDVSQVTKKDKIALTVAGGGFGAFLVTAFEVLSHIFNKKI